MSNNKQILKNEKGIQELNETPTPGNDDEIEEK